MDSHLVHEINVGCLVKGGDVIVVFICDASENWYELVHGNYNKYYIAKYEVRSESSKSKDKHTYNFQIKFLVS